MEIEFTFNTPPARIFDAMPDGWRILEGATTAPAGFVWIHNGKSIFDPERQTGLLPEGLAPSCWSCKHCALDLALGYICRADNPVKRLADKGSTYEINKPRNCKKWTK